MNVIGAVGSGVKKVVSSVTSALEINSATLSGAIDVIVVQHPDGTFKGSPFHVRFGKLHAMRTRNKVVQVDVNGVDSGLRMKLGSAGEAFFVEEVAEPALVDPALITSPIASPPPSGPSNDVPPFALDDSAGSIEPPPPPLPASQSVNDPDVARPPSRRSRRSSSRSSRRSSVSSHSANGSANGSAVAAVAATAAAGMDDAAGTETVADAAEAGQLLPPDSPMSGTSGDSKIDGDNWTWNWGTLPTPDAAADAPGTAARAAGCSDGAATTPPAGVLGTCTDASSPARRGTRLVDQGILADESAPPRRMTTLQHYASARSLQLLLPGQMQLSYCGHLLDSLNLSDPEFRVPDKVFDAHRITHEQFTDNPNVIFDPNTVFRVGDRYCLWTIALPLLVSQLVYQQPLPVDVVERLIREQQMLIGLPHDDDTGADDSDRNDRFPALQRPGWRGLWWWGRRRASGEALPTFDAQHGIQPSPSFHDLEAAGDGDHAHDSDPLLAGNPSAAAAEPPLSKAERRAKADTIPLYYSRKSLRLSSEQLASLDLKPGPNTVVFRITGTTREVAARIYLWPADARIVVTDIDGTITRSDVLGHVLPNVFGRDWSHPGVASLFSKIEANGYHVLYLTARSIGQAGITRDYIYGLSQGGRTLPDGPIFMSPERLLQSFHREVIAKRPEDFKIACLGDIRGLFPEGAKQSPFYAGFGNRVTDFLAYNAVSVPKQRIFVIDPASQTRVVTNLYTASSLSSYPSIEDIVHEVFPARTMAQDFSEQAYWSLPIPPLDGDDASAAQPIATSAAAAEAAAEQAVAQDQVVDTLLASHTTTTVTSVVEETAVVAAANVDDAVALANAVLSSPKRRTSSASGTGNAAAAAAGAGDDDDGEESPRAMC